MLKNLHESGLLRHITSGNLRRRPRGRDFLSAVKDKQYAHERAEAMQVGDWITMPVERYLSFVSLGSYTPRTKEAKGNTRVTVEEILDPDHFVMNRRIKLVAPGSVWRMRRRSEKIVHGSLFYNFGHFYNH